MAGLAAEWVRLETGSASALEWVTRRVRSQDCIRKIALGLTELSIPQTDTTVEISQQRFKNVPTGLHDSAIFAGEGGPLGNGLLSRFSSIAIDAKAGRMYLRTTPISASDT